MRKTPSFIRLKIQSLFLLCAFSVCPSLAQTAPANVNQPTILYGAAYYNEYMPPESEPALRPARLDKDVALMKEAGINVVRMGESTWSLWEPEDGHFEYAWMDRIVDAMGKAGIKVILGTPTYSVPTWMVHAHPEILVRYQGADTNTTYGMRQNMDTDNPIFRSYAQRLITNMVAHYRDNPTVIGWQIDNETGSYGAYNADVFAGFLNYLKQKFSTPEVMNKAWFLNYWGQDVNRWEDMPTPTAPPAPATNSSGPAGSRCVSPTTSPGRRTWCANRADPINSSPRTSAA
jgi:beta-galactosidase